MCLQEIREASTKTASGIKKSPYHDIVPLSLKARSEPFAESLAAPNRSFHLRGHEICSTSSDPWSDKSFFCRAKWLTVDQPARFGISFHTQSVKRKGGADTPASAKVHTTLLCFHKSTRYPHHDSWSQSPAQSHKEHGCYSSKTPATFYRIPPLEQAIHHTAQHHFRDVVFQEKRSQLWTIGYL